MEIKCSYNALGKLNLTSGSENNDFLQLPKAVGEGYFRYISTQCQPGISVCEFTPNKQLILKERMCNSNFYMLSFCLGEGMEWSFTEAGSMSFSIDRNESCVVTGGTEQCTSVYEAGQKYRGISVVFDPHRIQGVAECLCCENALNSSSGLKNGLKRYIVTPHVGGILLQMTDCNVCDKLKDIYLEGKLLELIAVYLDEMVCQRRDELSEISLSKEDLFALNRAKEVLDKTFVHPLTISQLSKRVYLNEYKLKTGFKQCFGQTIYGYILEKRMELARLLIEQQRFRISDIAGMVGYANTSHFISAFNKKYGATPGEFTKANITHK